MIGSSAAYDACFISRLSTMASMIRSQAAIGSNVVVPVRLASVESRDVGRPLPLGDAGIQECLNPAETLSQNGLVDLANDRAITRRGAHLGDTRAHEAAAQHADGANDHRLALLTTRGEARPTPQETRRA